MDKTDWMYVLAIVVLICTTILGLFEKLSADDVVKIFLLIIGAAIGGGVGYAVGRFIGFKQGAALLG